MKVKEKVLENDLRRKIYEFVKKNPGLHMRELQRRLDIPLSTLEYHLDYLQRRDILVMEDDRRYCRYFGENLDEVDRRVLSALRQKRMREIILLTLSDEMKCFKDLKDEIGIAASTLSSYLKNLENREILERTRVGNETCYSVNNEDNVIRSLLIYQSSFVDRLVDRVLESFLELEMV
jgi:predicted transcriptional regulator